MSILHNATPLGPGSITGPLTLLALALKLLPFAPDPIQLQLLTTAAGQVLLNCHRQWGKTIFTAVKALHQALQGPRQLIVVISPTLEQSKILTKSCRDFARDLGLRITTDGTNPRSVLFPNGSCILPIAADADHARGWSANLLIIDEAAYVPDDVYAAVTPLLAATRGELWLLSTPNGKRGFFFHEFSRAALSSHAANWLRLTAPAEGAGASGRLSPAFLAEERIRKTPDQFAQEYLCEFTTTQRNTFRPEAVYRAFRQDIPPFNPECPWLENFAGLPYRPTYFIGADLGKKLDHSAIALIEYRTIPTGTFEPYYRQPLFRRELHLRYLKQFPIGTPYLEVVPQLARLCRHPQIAGHGSLIVDATGHGECVVELIQRERLPVNFLAANITSGDHVNVTRWGRNVPKRELITRTDLLFEQSHLHIAATAKEMGILQHELLQYESMIGEDGHTRYGPASSLTHDDTVMALALAGWWAWENRKSFLAGDRHKPLHPFF
jgi:hypothetical protein